MSRPHSTEAFRVATSLAACAVLLAACSSAPLAPSSGEVASTVPATAGAGATASPDTSSPAQAAPASGVVANGGVANGAGPGGAAAAPVDIPPRAAADFARAVNLMRAGNATEAELE